MSIKQLQQLENIVLSNIVLSVDPTDEELMKKYPSGYMLKDNGNVLSNYLFEGSEFLSQMNEANSYYLSKKMNGLELSSLVLEDIWNKMLFLDNYCKTNPKFDGKYNSPFQG